MPEYIGGVRCRTSVPPHPLRILGQASDGGSRGGILHGGFPRFFGGRSGGPSAPHHFNVVVEAVVRQWILLVAGVARVKDGWVRGVLRHDAFF